MGNKYIIFNVVLQDHMRLVGQDRLTYADLPRGGSLFREDGHGVTVFENYRRATGAIARTARWGEKRGTPKWTEASAMRIVRLGK